MSKKSFLAIGYLLVRFLSEAVARDSYELVSYKKRWKN